jgi:biopolymer transport protein ExbB
MKKFFAFLAVAGALVFTANYAFAQDAAAAPQEETVATDSTVAEAPASPEDLFAAKQDIPLHQALKTKFIEGGAGFMSLIIICLIIGLALAIERIISLSFAKTNYKKLLKKVEDALAEGGAEKAIEVCNNSKSPVATIFATALADADKGIEFVERAVVNQGGIEESGLSSGLSWISLFIAIAPSLGFLGTVIGMIQAFDAIQAAGDISPNVVAGGMKVALITTVAGLIVAIILQVFYNYILAKIDGITVDMEEASRDLVNILYDYEKKNK